LRSRETRRTAKAQRQFAREARRELATESRSHGRTSGCQRFVAGLFHRPVPPSSETETQNGLRFCGFCVSVSPRRADAALRRRRSAASRLCGSVTLWLIALCALSVSVAGCRQDMHDQPKYVPFRESTFFPDQRSARPVVAGTVARGQLREDALLYTGKVNGVDATIFPFEVDERTLRRGQERFNIYCSPCHARTGEGDGLVVRRGYRRPPSYHDDRLRNAPVGHFFDVMTNGFGAMPDYAAQIKPEDRWAIAAYIRALQLSRSARLEDVPAADRGKLQ
jgi:mono/diheme cytochrome c family protein